MKKANTAAMFLERKVCLVCRFQWRVTACIAWCPLPALAVWSLCCLRGVVVVDAASSMLLRQAADMESHSNNVADRFAWMEEEIMRLTRLCAQQKEQFQETDVKRHTAETELLELRITNAAHVQKIVVRVA